MRITVWLIMGMALTFYLSMVSLFGFENRVALAVHFLRFATVTTALIIYLPALRNLFKEVPPPGRDYLLAGFVGFMLSNDYFSIMNEAGRIFKIDTSIFTSWQAAIGSVIVIVAAGFSVVAPGKDRTVSPYLAGAIATILAILLVFIAPLFRP